MSPLAYWAFRSLLVGAALSMSSCITIGLPVEGIVIDVSTGKPIAGAFVVAQWTSRGADLVGSRSSCPGFEVTRSDGSGRYRLPEGVAGPASMRTVFSFKPGYEWFAKDGKLDDSVMSMRPF
jgi:hypothetical protein